MSANAINSGAALPSIVGDYRVIIRWAFVRIPTRSQVFDWGSITGGAMAKLEIACAQDPTLDRRMPRRRRFTFTVDRGYLFVEVSSDYCGR